MPEITYREAVRDALGAAMRADDDVFIMGEDIAEMGGSMGVTQGLLDEFGPEPDRRDHVRGLPDALARADREPGGEAPLHVGRPDHCAVDDPHAGRRRL